MREERYVSYELMSRSDERIGLKSGWFFTVIPYSVSMPITFVIAMCSSRSTIVQTKTPGASRPPGENGGDAASPPLRYRSQVLAGVDDLLDVALLFFGLAHERLDVDDPLTLLARDLRPVVGIGGVGQVLVLLELFADRVQEILAPHALVTAADEALEGQLLAPPHDRLDHGPRREVLEVQDLLVAVGVGDLEEAVLLAEAVHRLDGLLDQ